MKYRDWQLTVGAPPWLLTPRAAAWLQAHGDAKDDIVDRLKQAVKVRFPDLAPDAALALIGAERQLPRAASESKAAYVGRLKGAWDAWPWAGTAKGVLSQLRDAGYPGTQIVIAKGLKYSLDSSQNIVITDLNPGIPPAYWSAFFVYFPPSAFPAGWSGTPPLQTTDEGKFIIGLVKKWKSAHARFDRVVFDMGGPIWGLSAWGGFNWGGAAPVIWNGPF